MKKLLAIAAVAVLINHVPVYAADEYRFTPIQVGGVGQAINNQNQIVGSLNNQAFFWDNGTLTDLGLGDGSIARDINDNGTIIGDKFSEAVVPFREVFITQNGTNSTSFVQRTAEGLVINNNEQALVNVANRNFDAFGYFVDNNIASEIEVNTFTTAYPFDPFVDVADLNNNGQVIGSLYTTVPGIAREGFLWENGSNITLGNFLPEAMNDSGLIIGKLGNESSFYDNGSITKFGDSFNAIALNNAGQVLGLGPDGYHIWQNGTYTSLNDLLDQSVDGWQLNNLIDINDNGWIIGRATNDLSGDSHLAILSPTSQVAPVPEANTFILVGLGLLGFFMSHRKQIQAEIV